MSEYDLMMKNRAPNPQMHKCRFCDQRFAEGQSCCTPTYLWNASDNGPAAARQAADGSRVYLPYGSANRSERHLRKRPRGVDAERLARVGFTPRQVFFSGKPWVCGQWRHHRWRGNKCKRCGTTRKVRVAKPMVEELVEA